jgi:hypothetical protein
MNPRWILCAGAAALGVYLVAAPEARAYNLFVRRLSLDQRDVRVFNNFSDPEANDNTHGDPNFPGAVGAPLALWKATAEWGSVRRYDGLGDPSQVALGGSGANFDSSWQGLASGVGGTDDNIASEISGSSLGVLAFCELPIFDGWRIRFYADAAVWMDGPEVYPFVPGQRDLEGVMTHEYGHALGLDHTDVFGSTMFPSPSGNVMDFRSIEADDQAGVRAQYGTLAPGKPRISTYALAGSQLTLIGESFASVANEVWFTNGAPLADGTPLKVGGLASSAGGTRLSLALPALALPGDVLVHVPGTAAHTLSNAFPFDPTRPPCPQPLVYGTSKLTSLGTSPDLSVSGRPTLATNDLTIAIAAGIPGAPGVLFAGAQQASIPFSGGTLWIMPPYRRVAAFQFDFLGGITLPVPVSPALIGSTRYFQIWFQDAGDPFGVGLSNAVQVTFCP